MLASMTNINMKIFPLVEKIRSIVEKNIENIFPQNLTVSIANDQSW